jgi:hypothetical protein
MAIDSIFITKLWGDAPDDSFSGSLEVNFSPQPATASAFIYQTIYDGRAALGIRSFEFRDTPGGPSKTKSFTNFYWKWPPSAFHKLMTRVTFGIDLYETVTRGGVRVDFGS